MTERALKLSEAAPKLGMGEDFLREIAAQGKIPCIRKGRNYLFVESLLDTWLIESALQGASISTNAPTPPVGKRIYAAPVSELDDLLKATKDKPQPKPAGSTLKLVKG